MILSARRKQFLQKLLELYRKKNAPVHYETLAEALGVSKWTSYDMLKKLEKLGYLIREYMANPGETGRSLLVFRPTAKTSGLFEQGRSESAQAEDWHQIRAKVESFLNGVKNAGLGDAVQRMAETAPDLARISFCAHLIGLFQVALRKWGDGTEAWVRQLVRSAPNPEMRTAVFVGTALGAIMQKANREIGGKAADLAGRFLRTVHELTDQEKVMLSDFLAEAWG